MRRSLVGALLGASLVIGALAGRSSSAPADNPPIDMSAHAAGSELFTSVTPTEGSANRHRDRSAAARDGRLSCGPQLRRNHAEERPQYHLGLADD